MSTSIKADVQHSVECQDNAAVFPIDVLAKSSQDETLGCSEKQHLHLRLARAKYGKFGLLGESLFSLKRTWKSKRTIFWVLSKRFLFNTV